MAKGTTKRALQQKHKQQAAEKARVLAWQPKRHNAKNIEYPSIFLNLARALRDVICAPLLTSTGWPILWLSANYSNLTPSAQSQKILGEFFQLSLVRRQVGREAEEVLIRANEFSVCFNVSSLFSSQSIDLARLFLPSQAASIISRLRKITVLDHAVIELRHPGDDFRDTIVVAACAYTLSHIAAETAGAVAINSAYRPDLQKWQEMLEQNPGSTTVLMVEREMFAECQMWQEYVAECFESMKSVPPIIGQPTRYALQEIEQIQRKQRMFLYEIPLWWRIIYSSLGC